jgi:hypothetical protein
MTVKLERPRGGRMHWDLEFCTGRCRDNLLRSKARASIHIIIAILCIECSVICSMLYATIKANARTGVFYPNAI